MTLLRKWALLLGILIISGGMISPSAFAQSPSHLVYELRTYTATPGNLDKLLARFREHTMRIFEKHGMKNIGYWIPIEGEESANSLVYLLAHESEEAAMRSWQAFSADPEWQKVNEESNAGGPILQSVVRKFMHPTDFSPLE